MPGTIALDLTPDLQARDPIGYAGLIAAFGLDCIHPRTGMAFGAAARKEIVTDGPTSWTLLPRGSSIRPPASRIDHLGIALKHEGIDLRVLDRLFAAGIEDELLAFVRAGPKGQYRRRAWFLYEWLTGRELPLPDVEGIAYVPLLDPAAYFTAAPLRSFRHKIENNLPGVPGFCPLVRRTERLTAVRLARLKTDAAAVLETADPAMLRRAVSYMLLSESKGSFGIEGETPPQTRLERWGHIIATAGTQVLSIPELNRLQRSLFEKQKFLRPGLRTVGGFVGRHDPIENIPIPDHISARHEDLPALLGALIRTYERLNFQGFDPVLLAATIGFGFVFIHPFEDGNGRLHRFLIQKALIDGGFSPPGVVLPVSAAILEDLSGYRAVLEDYSRPMLETVEWEPTADGNVTVLNHTAYLYSYFDATRQAEYLAERIDHTVHVAMPAELRYLAQFDAAKRNIAAVADMPDRLAGLLIQFCIQNGGTVSARKRQDFFPGATDAEMAALEAAVLDSGIVSPGPDPGRAPSS